MYVTQKSDSDKSEGDAQSKDPTAGSQSALGCTLCHIPYSNKLGLPVTGKMKKCAVCKLVHNFINMRIVIILMEKRI